MRPLRSLTNRFIIGPTRPRKGNWLPGGERGLATIRTFLFVDVRGYTRFTVERGDAAAARLIEKFDVMARRVFTAWHGEVVGEAGDELVAVFGSARDALRAAVQLQADFAEEAETNPALPQVGIGLDTGEAVPTGDTFIGGALNLAARLCKLAGPQEVLASETVTHVAGKLDDITYVERGFTQLKGFRDPVHVFQVVDVRQAPQPAKPSVSVSFGLGGAAPLPIGNFLGALPSTELVVREAELKRVLDAADAVAAGSGRLVLVSGEPGVGKTRLAQEAMLTARNRQFLVATGRCYEQQKSVPFYPFIDVLSSVYSSCPSPIRAAVVGRWPYLYRLLPDFSAEPIPAVASTSEEQQRLFRAVAGFLQAISAQTPVGIFLDDLHVADGPSLDLLQHLARNSRGARILMVGTYRDVEVGPHHPLEAALRDLTREELVDRIQLRRFESDGTSKLIATTLGDRSAPSDLVAVVHRQAEGNPFFTQQLVRFLVERGDLYQADGRWVQRPTAGVAVPESVRSVIGQRMARLGEKTQELLREASVLGQAFRFDTLAALPGHTEEEIEASLEEARSAGLVTETQQDGYAFDHMLTQQTLYTDLPARKRARLHLAAAEALELLPEKARTLLSSELAWHFLEAAQEERAIPYALAAGDRATSVFAYREANRQYGVAFDIAQRVGSVPGEVGALTRRAKLCLDMFQGKNAAQDYERLLEVAQKEGDRRLELSARLGLEGAYYVVALDETEGDSISRCRTMSEAAYDLARLLGDTRAMVQALLGTQHFVDFWPEYLNRWRDNAREALALSRELGDPELVIEGELVTWNEGSRSESIARGERLVKQLKERNELFHLNELYFDMMWTQIEWADYAFAVETSNLAIHLAQEIGVPPVQYPTLRAVALLQLGRYGEAWESLQEEVTDSDHPFGKAMQALGVAQYHWELQAFEEAARACRDLQQRATKLRRAWMSRRAAGLLARSLAHRGGLDASTRREIQQEVERLGGRVPHEVTAEILLAEGKADGALREASAMADEARAGDRMADLLRAFELQARALLNLRRPREAADLLLEGCKLARERQALSTAWRLLALKGRALRESDDPEGAKQAFRESAAIIRHVGDSIRDSQERARFFASDSVASVLEGSD
jgi:class 3 adenylate cyclase